MTAKSIKSLKLHYKRIQFLINYIINCFHGHPQVILLEMAKFEVFTKSSGMRTHMPKALVVTVLGPQNDHNTNAAKSLQSFAKQLEISGVKVSEIKTQSKWQEWKLWKNCYVK